MGILLSLIELVKVLSLELASLPILKLKNLYFAKNRNFTLYFYRKTFFVRISPKISILNLCLHIDFGDPEKLKETPKQFRPGFSTCPLYCPLYNTSVESILKD